MTLIKVGGGVVPQRNLRLASVLRSYRERAGLTQSDVGKASQIVSREYVSGVELGRIAVVYPEIFNELRRLYKFPGFEVLEAMGYDTDCETAGVKPRLAMLINQLDESQQDALASIARTMIR